VPALDCTPAQGTLGRTLDYGCGSGILAIGAAKFGATDVDAVDIDPAAVESTNYNSSANHVESRPVCPMRPTASTRPCWPISWPRRSRCWLRCCAAVQAGGNLVLAGILERQADELKEAYAPYLKLEVADSEDGWILMTARRAA
jgi:ribosomal protein L11 methyltransferase